MLCSEDPHSRTHAPLQSYNKVAITYKYKIKSMEQHAITIESLQKGKKKIAKTLNSFYSVK